MNENELTEYYNLKIKYLEQQLEETRQELQHVESKEQNLKEHMELWDRRLKGQHFKFE